MQALKNTFKGNRVNDHIPQHLHTQMVVYMLTGVVLVLETGDVRFFVSKVVNLGHSLFIRIFVPK